MSFLFPSASTLSATFGHATPYRINKPTPVQRSPYEARSHLYPSWDVAEDAKNKAGELSDKAIAELDKASQKAQSKVGKIELYSGKYYAVCRLHFGVKPYGRDIADRPVSPVPSVVLWPAV